MKNYYFSTYSLLLFIAIVSIFTSCKKSACEEKTFHFGGKISNAKTKYLLFGKDDSVLDTLFLNENNQFHKCFSDYQEGMYVMKYENFIKYIYFENNDSIYLNANAQDFHNLTSFHGRGNEKNNFLFELFAITFENNNSYQDIFQENYNNFMKSVDSVKLEKEKLYQKRKGEISWNNEFDQYAKALIDYVYFTRLEAYSFIRKRYKHLENDPLPKNYFDFRKKVNFNEEKFSNYLPFTHYLTMLMTSISYEKNVTEPLEKGLLRLQIVDSMIDNQKVKERILSDLAFMYMLEDQNVERNNEFMKHYLSIAKDQLKIDEIENLNKCIASFENHEKLKDFEFRSVEGKSFYLLPTIQKPTLIFFWSSYMLGHLNTSTERIKELKKRHLNLDVVAINVDNDPNVLQKYKGIFQKDFRYIQAKHFNELKKDWVILKLNRAIYIDKDGTVKKGFVNMQKETIQLD